MKSRKCPEVPAATGGIPKGEVRRSKKLSITACLANGGALEHAQEMAAHESPRTTKLYDRTSDRVSLDEVERVTF